MYNKSTQDKRTSHKSPWKQIALSFATATGCNMFDLQFHQEMLGNRSVSRMKTWGPVLSGYTSIRSMLTMHPLGFSRKMTEFRVEKPPWHQAFGHRLNCFPTFCGMSFFLAKGRIPPKKNLRIEETTRYLRRPLKLRIRFGRVTLTIIMIMSFLHIISISLLNSNNPPASIKN